MIPSLVEVQGLVCGGSLFIHRNVSTLTHREGKASTVDPEPARVQGLVCDLWRVLWRSHTRGSFSLPGFPGRGSSGIRDVYRCEGYHNMDPVADVSGWGSGPPAIASHCMPGPHTDTIPPASRGRLASGWRLVVCVLQMTGERDTATKESTGDARRIGYDRPRPRQLRYVG